MHPGRKGQWDNILLYLKIDFNLFVPNARFLFPFRMFSKGIERVHWKQMV